MAVETELKLRIAPEHMERLRLHPFLRQFSSGRAVTHTLRNTYFDTPQLKLRRHEMALRLRNAGNKWLQTLKGGGGVEAGLHSRNEWETAVAGEALDLPALRAAGGKLPSGVGKQLEPVFSTDFKRTVRQLNYRGAAIELCLDSGEIRAGDRTRPISELELELKSGEPRQLFELALELLELVPLEVEPYSKAAYGYWLHAGARQAAVKSSFPSLEQAQDVPSALRGMIAACLVHVQANVPGAMGRVDDEYLHQVRVGLRRLRVALALAKARRHAPELDVLRSQTNDLGERLGVARDWDVFVTQILSPMIEQYPGHAGLAAVLRASEEKRREGHVVMRENLGGRDLSRLMLHMGGWLQGEYWHAAAAGRVSLPDFAVKVLRKRAKEVNRHGKRITDGAPAELHALRIACKKLRYSGDMLGTLFKAGPVRHYLAAMSSLQNALGVLNDIATARRLLADKRLVEDPGTLELIHDWMERDYAKRLVAARRAWKRFAGQAPFWEA